jgi:DNA polymerase-3 subunit gamma/tau
MAEPAPDPPRDEPAATGIGPDSPTVGALRRRSSAAGGRGTARAGVANAPDATRPTTPEAPDPDPEPDGEAVGRPEIPAPVGADDSTEAFPSRDALVQAWGDHVISGLRPKAKALFQAGRFVGVEDDRAVFGLPNETHRTRCEEMRGEVEAALASHFGRPVSLVLVVDPGADPAGDPPRAPGPTPTDQLGGQGRASDRGRDPGPVPPDEEDPSIFDESELGEVADVDTSAEARLLQAFPGAEEVR